MAAEGKAIAKVNDLVIFVPYVVPGDIVDLQIKRKKHHYAEVKQYTFIGTLQKEHNHSVSTMVYAADVNGKCYLMKNRFGINKSRLLIT